jgi:hypothetical protein
MYVRLVQHVRGVRSIDAFQKVLLLKRAGRIGCFKKFVLHFNARFAAERSVPPKIVPLFIQ